MTTAATMTDDAGGLDGPPATPGLPLPAGATVALDADEVLADWAEVYVDWVNGLGRWPALTFADLESYDVGPALGLDPDATSALLHEFDETGPGLGSLLPVPGSQEACERLRAAGHPLVVVTARGARVEQVTFRWLAAHYPGMFRPDDVAFCNHLPGAGGAHVTKASACLALGASAIVEDNPWHAHDVAAAVGAAVLLDRDFPWLRTTPTPEGVTRARTWEQAVDLVLGP